MNAVLHRIRYCLKLYLTRTRLEEREYIIDPTRKLVYAVNSKVACSSIKAAMFAQDIPDDYSIHHVTKSGNVYRKFGKLTAEEASWFSFSYVRNPFDRLVSCYESKYHHDIKMGQPNNFADYLDGLIAEDRGFDRFARQVCAIPSRMMDRHFMIQSDIMGGVQHVAKYEDMAEDFAEIQRKYDLKPLPHFNNSGGSRRDWRAYYTTETAKLVHKKYKKDFERFGYEDSYRELLDYLKQQGK